MKILLATNKTYAGHVDLGHWYTYKPLVELGHKVFWHDTVNPEMPDFGKVIEHFKPDLIFCCITGNPALTPAEPAVWEAIKKRSLGALKHLIGFVMIRGVLGVIQKSDHQQYATILQCVQLRSRPTYRSTKTPGIII